MKSEFFWGNDFDEFLASLNVKEKAKVLGLIKKIEEFGILIAIRQQWVKKLDNNLFEIRVRAENSFLRGIYFQVQKNQYYLALGFKKKKQSNAAEKNYQSYKNKERFS